MLLTQNRFPTTHFDRLFQDFFGSSAAPVTGGPAADLHEDETAAVLRLDVPGWTMENLEVTVQQDVVRVRGQREAETVEKTRWLVRERRAANFERAFRLPFEAATDEVEATLEDGVLTVRLPKAKDTLPRRIEVKGLPKQV